MRTAVTAIILLWATSTLASSAYPNRRTMEDETASDKNVVSIINSGSTNTAGFLIKVQRSGKASWSLTGRLGGRYADPASRGGEGQLADALTKQLFDDVESAMPLTQFPDKGCAKSRSFGYTISVRYLGQWSPDLTCKMTEPKLIQLKGDMQEICKTLHVGNQMPRQPSN